MSRPTTQSQEPWSSQPAVPANRGQVVPSVERAIGILNTLASQQLPATLASLSQQLELPRSSTLALCNTLQRAGLVVRDGNKMYRLGPSTLELSRAYLAETDLHGEFQRLCRKLNVLPEQTLVLGVLNGADTVYIGQRPGLVPVAMSYELGLHLPAHCTATGKALLSALDPDDVQALYGRDDNAILPTLTPKSVNNLPTLVEQLAEGRERGYTIDDEETSLGMVCVGSPVRDATGSVVGAVATSMVKAAVGAKGVSRAASEIRRLAAHLSAALGDGGNYVR